MFNVNYIQTLFTHVSIIKKEKFQDKLWYFLNLYRSGLKQIEYVVELWLYGAVSIEWSFHSGTDGAFKFAQSLWNVFDFLTDISYLQF